MKRRYSFFQQNKTLGNTVVTLLLLVAFSLVPMAGSADAQSDAELSTGGTVYVSVYSRIFSAPKAVTVSLTALLSIRNTNPKYPITALSVEYFDSEVKLMRSLVKKPIQVNPQIF